jgi:hypothetical protein
MIRENRSVIFPTLKLITELTFSVNIDIGEVKLSF